MTLRPLPVNDLAKPTLVPHTCDDSHLRRRGRPAVDVMPQAKCDRCDGPHPSSECPAFRWGRHDHPDAQPMPHGDRPQITPAAPPIDRSGRQIDQATWRWLVPLPLSDLRRMPARPAQLRRRQPSRAACSMGQAQWLYAVQWLICRTMDAG